MSDNIHLTDHSTVCHFSPQVARKTALRGAKVTLTFALPREGHVPTNIRVFQLPHTTRSARLLCFLKSDSTCCVCVPPLQLFLLPTTTTEEPSRGKILSKTFINNKPHFLCGPARVSQHTNVNSDVRHTRGSDGGLRGTSGACYIMGPVCLVFDFSSFVDWRSMSLQMCFSPPFAGVWGGFPHATRKEERQLRLS